VNCQEAYHVRLVETGTRRHNNPLETIQCVVVPDNQAEVRIGAGWGLGSRYDDGEDDGGCSDSEIKAEVDPAVVADGQDAGVGDG